MIEPAPVKIFLLLISTTKATLDNLPLDFRHSSENLELAGGILSTQKPYLQIL